MVRLLAVALLLVGGAAGAQLLPDPNGAIYSLGGTVQYGGGYQDGVVASLSSSTSTPPAPVFQVAYLTSGPLIADDANTVAHVTWNGTALVDSKGNTWTQNGTVPQVTGPTASPMFNSGFLAAPRSGAGPSSDSNYYTRGINSPLAFTGDFTMCLVFSLTSDANLPVLVSDGVASTSGYYVEIGGVTAHKLGLITYHPGLVYTETANSVVTGANAVEVGCVGRAGTTLYAELDGSTVASNTGATVSVDTTSQAALGRYAASTTFSVSGTIYEMWATTTTPTSAGLQAIQERVLNEIAGTGQVVADSRNTTATYTTNGQLWTAPANVPRVEVFTDGGGGLLVEGSSTNLVLQSGNHAAGAWTVNAGATAVANQGAAPDGTNTMTLISALDAGAADASVYQGVTFSSSSGPWTQSTWLAATTGTVTASLLPTTGIGQTLATCTCGTFTPGVTCTATIVSSARTCQAAVTVGTTPVRVWATMTATSAQTTAYPQVAPGVEFASQGLQVLAWGTQFESLGVVTSYIPTTSTAVTRAADSVSSTFAYTLGAQSMSESADVLYFGQTAGAQQTLIAAEADSTDLWYLNINATPAASLNGYFSSTSHLAASASSPSANVFAHYLGTYDGANENACLNGSCTPAAFSFSAPTSFTSVSIGVDPQATTGPLNGLIKNVCVGLKGACQ